MQHQYGLKDIKEPKQNSVPFSEVSFISDKIDKLTSLIGKLATQATQNRQSVHFKPRVS